MNGYTRAQLVGLITLIAIGLIILFAGSKIVNYMNRPEAKEVVQNENVKKDNFNLVINGDFVYYIGINEEYKEEGAKATIDGKNISDKIAISYYNGGTQVSSIDTSEVSSYIVKYEASYQKKLKEVTRVVIVTDNQKPHLIVPDTVVITSDEVANYDTTDGVVATDNSGEVSFDCDNTLSTKVGNYVIACTARDARGNVTTRNRLIKVTGGIEFKDDGNLVIEYPSGDGYSYKYSLDGGVTWRDASIKESLDVSGNVIALVLENGKYKMSSTYYKK